MATISAPGARLLSVQPYDATQIKAIEKAIMESDLGLTPSNDGKLIRLPIPALTEERRKELVKLVRRYAEDGKVAIRNVRRDVMRHLEELVRNGDVGDDEERRAETQVQKLTDDHVKQIDELLKHKEAEIMEV
jgi:ribosome recycling factor